MVTFKTDEAELLSNYLPSGVAWEAKAIEGSNINGLINGLGYEFKNMQERIDYIKKELNMLTTEDLISKWEKMYGIPNDYFKIDGKTIEQRQFQLFISELMDGADSAEDWEHIASLLGYKVKVYSALNRVSFPLTFPFLFVDVPRYTIIVDMIDVEAPSLFPLTFPLVFGSNNSSDIRGIFEVIKPSNCDVLYNYIKS